MAALLFRALSDLASRDIRRIVWRAGLVALILLLVSSVGLSALIPLVPETPWTWLDAIIDFALNLGLFAAAIILFLPVMLFVAAQFAPAVAVAVERRHYQGLAPAKGAGTFDEMRSALGLAGAALVLNLLALPVYLFLPGLNLALYFVLNGLLIGREYFELVALRRLPADSVRRLRKRYPARVFAAGGAVAFLLLLPGVNILVPTFATILMVHLLDDFVHIEETRDVAFGAALGAAYRLDSRGMRDGAGTGKP